MDFPHVVPKQDCPCGIEGATKSHGKGKKIFQDVRVIDPANNRDAICDIVIEDEMIAEVTEKGD